MLELFPSSLPDLIPSPSILFIHLSLCQPASPEKAEGNESLLFALELRNNAT